MLRYAVGRPVFVGTAGKAAHGLLAGQDSPEWRHRSQPTGLLRSVARLHWHEDQRPQSDQVQWRVASVPVQCPGPCPIDRHEPAVHCFVPDHKVGCAEAGDRGVTGRRVAMTTKIV